MLKKCAICAIMSVLVLGIFLSQQCLADSEINIYISNEGNDFNSGLVYDKPIKTFDALKSKIKLAKEECTEATSINVFFRGGKYYVDDVFFLTQEDSGDKNVKIEYKNYPGDKVIFSGGRKLPADAFKKIDDKEVYNRIAPQARNKVYCVDLKSLGINDYGSITRSEMHKNQDSVTPSYALFVIDNQMMTLSEWPNIRYTKITSVINSNNNYGVSIDEERFARWKNIDDVYAYGTFNYEWADDTLKLNATDPSTNTAYFSEKTIFGMEANEHSYIKFINVLEELDVPGEWYVDSKTGMLYVYPKGDIYSSNIEFVNKTTPIISVEDIENVHFSGFIFENTCANAIELRNANNVTISDCEFRNIGIKAVYMYNVNECGVKRCHIHDVGKGGVFIKGGDNKNLECGNNYVENCNIERFSLIGTKASDAVIINGSGNRISHNRISNASHRAIHWTGYNTLVEYNDIYNVVKETPDMGAIYQGGFVNCGSQIKYNYIHNLTSSLYSVGGRPAIYNDDFATGIDNSDNIIYKANLGIKLHNAMNTNVTDNVFINCNTSVIGMNLDNLSNGRIDQINAKADEYYREGTLKEMYDDLGYNKCSNAFKTLLNNLDIYDKEDIKYTAFPYLNDILEGGEIFSAKNNIIRNNKFISSGSMNISGKMSLNSEIADNISSEFSFDDETLTVEKYNNLKNEFALTTPDLSNIGITGEYSDSLSDFKILFPNNMDKNIDANDITFGWEDISGATKYRLVVATDRDFKDIVVDDVVDSNYKRVRGLRYGCCTYYWKVMAIGTSHLFIDDNLWNCNGIYEFETSVAASEICINDINAYNMIGQPVYDFQDNSVTLFKIESENLLSENLNAVFKLTAYNSDLEKICSGEIDKNLNSNGDAVVFLGLNPGEKSDIEYVNLEVTREEYSLGDYTINGFTDTNVNIESTYCKDECIISNAEVVQGKENQSFIKLDIENKTANDIKILLSVSKFNIEDEEIYIGNISKFIMNGSISSVLILKNDDMNALKISITRPPYTMYREQIALQDLTEKAPSGTKLTFKNFEIQDESGKILPTLKCGSMNNVNVALKNISASDINATIILAFYDMYTNELISCSLSNSNLVTNDIGYFKFEVNVPDSNYVTAKIFLWKGNDSMEPLYVPIYIKCQ